MDFFDLSKFTGVICLPRWGTPLDAVWGGDAEKMELDFTVLFLLNL